MAIAAEPQPKSGLPGNLLVIALVLVLAWQAAYWTWVFLAPPPVAAPAESQSPVDLAAVARLFGATAPGQATRASSSLKLKGVIAPTPGTVASAIFSTGAGRDIAVYIDGEVEPGMKLAEVHPDHVIVTRAGVRGRIDLEAPHATASASPRGMPGRVTGFKLNVARTGSNNYSLSRKELDEALRDPGQLNFLGQIGTPPKGGVRMELAPPGSLAQKLGLQPGDVIKKVNGQTVASAGDLARLYTQFNTLSTIQAEIQRGQSTLQLSYAIQP
jgi:general secretion pathway protein C